MADEHPARSSSHIEAGDVARREFGTVRRGFDPQEVRAYLELLGSALEQARRREQELVSEVHEAEERARHPVIDESVLTSSLGQHSAAVLRSAHEEAARILSQAEESAASMVREAQQQATDIQVNAESSAAERIAEAELEANSLQQQAREQASAVVETARVEGEAVVERARDQGRAMLDQAQEARRRVLADMAHRRRLVTEQIELFRAARDEIAGSVVGVRRSVDRIVEDLSRAEESARTVAAGAAARPQAVDVPEPVLVEEGERAVAELAERHETQEAETGEEPEAKHPESRPVLRFDDIATVVKGPDPGASNRIAPSANGTDAEVQEAEVQEEEAVGAAVALVDEAVVDGPVEMSPAADPAAGGSDVDGLFARLRARQADDETDDARVSEGPVSPEATVVEDAEVGEGERVDDAEPSPDAEMFTRRAEVLGPITTTLARRLKRALQDDQNGLLDRLRQGTGEWRDDILFDVSSQRELYAKAATDPVREAVTAGASFARSIFGGRRSKATPTDEHTIDAVSGELASTVVSLIRRRLESGDAPDAAERIGAAYREWRGDRIERLAEDSAIEAFSKGVLVGAAKRSVRWSRSDVGPGCADCEDNGLAGTVAAGAEFPTGHRHPPAHAGCRCLLLPTPN